ncbi:MAG: helix-turn-helix domain-containing protein [Bacteroidota bacterium]
MQIDITSTIYLFAIMMAVLLIAMIGRKEKQFLADRYLMAALTTLSITLLHYVAILNRWAWNHTILVHLGATAWLTISPLLYLFVRSLVERDAKWKWQNLCYFPFSLYMILQLFLSLSDTNIGFFMLFKDADAYSISWILVYLLNSLGFTWATLRLLKRSNWSAKQTAQMRWLPLFFRGFAVVVGTLVVWLLWCLRVDYFFQQLEYVLLLFYVAFIFALVVYALKASTYWNVLLNHQYGHAKKDKEELSDLHAQLLDHLKTQPLYLNPKLTLHQLAAATQIAENQLSQLFNQHLHTNFYRFINDYRLAAFQRQIATKDAQQYTIIALAEASGFASKATFYKAFKDRYGMTPTAYLKQMKMEEQV